MIEWLQEPFMAPAPRHHGGGPLPFAPPGSCPPGSSYVDGKCRPFIAERHPSQGPLPFAPPLSEAPRALGAPVTSAVDQAHAKTVLGAWGVAPGVSSPLLGYGPLDVATPGWSERDGIMLHAFAAWWTGTPKLNAQADVADSNGVVVAQLTTEALAALDNWAAANVGQVPGVLVLDIAASKGLLVVWAKTDGAKSSGALPDYGANPADVTASWTTRDTTELQLFQGWWNAQGKAALPTAGSLDVASSNALKTWFAERLAAVPAGWLPPAAQPQGPPPAQQNSCPQGQVWDSAANACQPLPTPPAPLQPPSAGGATTNKALWWGLGILAAAGGLAWFAVSKSGAVAAPVRGNPAGYYVHVRGGNNETYGPYPTLQRAKTFARIGATKGAHDRVVLRGGKVVRHYRAGTGESLVH